MLQITSKRQAEAVEPLLSELSYPQAIRAMLAGNSNGWVWVDQLERPRLMLAWDGRTNIYIARRKETTSRSLGLALRQDLQDTLEQQVFHMAALAGVWGYVVQSGPRFMTDPLVNELLRGHESLPDARLLFVMDIETSVPPKPAPIEGVEIRRVDAALLAETDREHHGDLQAWIEENWPSTDRYLDYGFGYAAVAGNSIVGWCMAEAMTERECGIGIETVEGYRRSGIGRLTAQAFLAEARRRLIRPWWDAWHSNLGSVRLAQSLGLRQDTNYGVRFGWYNLLDNAVVHLTTALDRGDSRAAYGWLKRVLQRSAMPMRETAKLWPDEQLEQRMLANPRLAAMLAKSV